MVPLLQIFGLNDCSQAFRLWRLGFFGFTSLFGTAYIKGKQRQTGFIQQRQTFENIRRSQHALEQTARDKIKAMIVGLDAEKAFDSVRWLFLYKALEKFGFKPNFIILIKTLYNKTRACIKINGDLSDSFILERGTRQGCLISPLLFALY